LRFPQSLRFDEPPREGWPDVFDIEPPWTTTIVARWHSSWVDWSRVVIGGAVAATAAAFTVLAWRNGSGLTSLIPAAVAIWFGWETVRDVRSRRLDREMTLVLAPDHLRLTSSEASWPGAVLWRERAGWLVEDEIRTDWHVRGIWIHDQNDKLVAQFVGGLAAIEVREPGIPPGRSMATELPVSVLLGTWWPHPARRTSRRGTMSRPVRWLEPDIMGYPRHERRNRLQWSLLYGGFAALFVLGAVAGESQAWIRVAFGIAAIVLSAWRVHVHRWRPTFLTTQGPAR
jgi:hypothetical protein